VKLHSHREPHLRASFILQALQNQPSPFTFNIRDTILATLRELANRRIKGETHRIGDTYEIKILQLAEKQIKYLYRLSTCKRGI
jgi:hypothetical protein